MFQLFVCVTWVAMQKTSCWQTLAEQNDRSLNAQHLEGGHTEYIVYTCCLTLSFKFILFGDYITCRQNPVLGCKIWLRNHAKSFFRHVFFSSKLLILIRIFFSSKQLTLMRILFENLCNSCVFNGAGVPSLQVSCISVSMVTRTDV